MRAITLRQLRDETAAILGDVHSGRHLIVTRNGTPVAESRPVSPRRFVPRSVVGRAAATARRIDAAPCRADLDALVDRGVKGLNDRPAPRLRRAPVQKSRKTTAWPPDRVSLASQVTTGASRTSARAT